MFRIKICGITRAEDAMAAVAAGADAIGLNFYPPSPRFVPPEMACQICQAVPPHINKVGVFVNAPTVQIRAIAQRVALDYVQLHGTEPVQQLIELASWPTIRAIRQGEFSVEQLSDDLEACRQAGACPAAVLVDSASLGVFGGSGEAANWHKAAGMRGMLQSCRFILAGGLRPENVWEALRQVRPDGVDVASGVESCPGVKSPELMARFVRQARSFWQDDAP